MDECSIVRNLLIDYINRNLSREENSRVILHLSRCRGCLDELKEIIKFRDMLNSQLKDVPEEIKATAYDKLKQENQGLSEILESKSPFMAFDLLNYAFKPVQETLDVVAHLI